MGLPGPEGVKRSLSELEQDALREVGNIGASNATTALSQLLGDRLIRVTVPDVARVPLAELAERLGSPEEPVVAVVQVVRGGLRAKLAVLLPVSAADLMLGALLPGEDVRPSFWSGFSPDAPENLPASALLEIGNIILTAYLNALGELTHLTLIPSVPAAAHDMKAAVLGSMLAEPDLGDAGVLVIETRFTSSELGHFDGHVLFLPARGQLRVLLSALGLAGEAP